nr:unnamed protein product [Callosobruchus analis]
MVTKRSEIMIISVPLNSYRGAAHEGCNINFKDNHTIPVVLHNLSGYDAHFIIKNVDLGMNGRVDLLSITKERYIAFTKNIHNSLVSFRSIDSLKFMNSSLDKLSSYLTEFPILKSEFPQCSEEHIKLLTKKGIYLNYKSMIFIITICVVYMVMTVASFKLILILWCMRSGYRDYVGTNRRAIRSATVFERGKRNISR